MGSAELPRAWNSAQQYSNFLVTDEHHQASTSVHFTFSSRENAKGRASVIELFPGITMVQFEIKSRVLGAFYDIPPQINLRNSMNICYCKQGSVELDRVDELSAVLQENEIGLGALAEKKIVIRCPVGYVAGVGLTIKKNLKAATRRLLTSFGVDPTQILSLCSATEKMQVLNRSEELEEACEALCFGHTSASKNTYRLKVLEILQHLGKSDAKPANPNEEKHRRSTHLSHVELAYRAQQILMDNVATPITINTLAMRCDTSGTVLKEAFRETFGTSIYQWYRTYRIKQAAQTLLDTNLTIAEVASSVGYVNPSKFTKAFVDTMGETPRVWRAKHKQGSKHQKQNAAK